VCNHPDCRKDVIYCYLIDKINNTKPLIIDEYVSDMVKNNRKTILYLQEKTMTKIERN